jgi:Fe-Mn family superoxide dismutase
MGKYKLPELDYGYKDLEPYISEEIMTLHHGKHHQAYINGANETLEKLDIARRNNQETDQKSLLKTLSFNLGGHVLHSVFWRSMGPPKEVESKPEGALLDTLEMYFSSWERFKKEFHSAALSAEGSGWAALVYHQPSGSLLIMQIEKHNANCYPGSKILLPLDVWEHAYYLDYKNARAKYIDAWWNVVNWKFVGSEFEKIVTA